MQWPQLSCLEGRWPGEFTQGLAVASFTRRALVGRCSDATKPFNVRKLQQFRSALVP